MARRAIVFAHCNRGRLDGIERHDPRVSMTCRELIDFLMAYLDGELPAARRALFDAHLEACEDCRRYLATYREAIALGRDACADDAAPVSDEVPDDLVEAILATRSGRCA